ncbi:MAG: phytoene dehydrogenase [Candidatus Wallbacteria bacterium HGW-Wallbacteria-1]|uniref:Phytoene dehydrogenase n=1 Tax=Candidatus Wallbacteria bacterium HGW-Wallbacteria-1 TaxID=2013854 RepID=A0A2N1PUC5_9BACT|nr:MAG: phytoene dehydrogenase [Candidatus Wallbacteria bacterium HGW-Wallbacteria-1]
MTHIRDEYDSIVIGAGMSGLAAGIRLAHYGQKVAIFESHSLAGGLNSYYSRGGRLFDVGLHAVTNHVEANVRSAPMNKLCRQLRIKSADLGLCPQIRSRINFPSASLEFTNDFDSFRQSVSRFFPGESEGLDRFVQDISGDGELSLNQEFESTRKKLGKWFTSPLFMEMLCCPLMYYGNAWEEDMDFSQFVIMFKSIFLEGFARPREGVTRIIDLLVSRYRECGGELHMKTPVKSIISRDGAVRGVILADGRQVLADRVFSSAGIAETHNLVDYEASLESETSHGEKTGSEKPRSGKLSFVEAIFVLDRSPASLGMNDTIHFFSRQNNFAYRQPDTFMDMDSGVLCCPNNFDYRKPLEEGILRITHMANHDKWAELDRSAYRRKKEECLSACAREIEEWFPGFAGSIVATDFFTPVTVRRFTGHHNGAVYGSPDKSRDGRTAWENLYIIGTDQGFLGIIGSMLSGISIANLRGLMSR